MKQRIFTGFCTAAALALGTAAFAQTTGQAQSASQPPAAPVTAQAQERAMENVTVTGCVQREADYRQANNLGKGGAVGTGVGVDNEFVLVNVQMSAAGTTGAPTSSNPTTPATAPTATGTAGDAPAYELTGSNEGQASAFIGKRVQIVGMLKKADVDAAGTTGGVTAGNPPTGVDVASKDLRLRELEIASITETTGTCTPDAKK